MAFDLFGTAKATAFARDLAQFVLAELNDATAMRDAKFTARAEKVRVAAARRLQDFKKGHSLNVISKSKLANSFLWTLKDAGCSPEYADELTEWLTLRL